MHDPLYRQNILDHYKHPRHFGELARYTHEFGHQNISCGDAVRFQVLVEDNVIKEIGFTGQGCAISIATASMIAESLAGKPFSDIEKLTKQDIEDLLGLKLSGARELCALLGVETLKRLTPVKKTS